MDRILQERLRTLRAAEEGPGVRLKDAPLRVSLLYPSPYHVAMSSLGYLEIHRRANARPGTRCVRAMLPGPADRARHAATRTPLLTIEDRRPAREAHVIGISQAYELELSGVVALFDLMGLSPFAKDRTASDPLVVLGGPITFSNPLPSAPFADVVVMGEGEQALDDLLDRLEENPSAARGDPGARGRLLDELSSRPGFLVPAVHGPRLPPLGQAPSHLLPAVSAIRTPHTELHNMVLIEPERGCHRGCTFCVMRRSTNGGMRLVDVPRVLDLIPEDAPRVGLVGAAVTDHPRIKDLLRTLIDDRGHRVGISSLRADRLDAEFVQLLARGGYRSMTVALDAASARLRDHIEKNIKDQHIDRAATLARDAGMRHLKLYVIIGLPGETEADLEELAEFVLGLKRILPVVITVSPFVPKLNTPLAAAPFAGQQATERSLRWLKRRLARQVDLRGPSAREAYVEYRLAQGGFEHAPAAVAAARAGGGLSAWRRALSSLPERGHVANFADLIPAPTFRRNHRPGARGSFPRVR